MAEANSTQIPLIDTGPQVKRCRKCGDRKPVDQFYVARHGKASRDRLQAYCRQCSNDNFRAWRLGKQYGLTIEAYQAMLEEQRGLCAICGKAEIATTNFSDSVRSMAIDHDHVTGKVRSLLCTKCNTGLGAFEDNPELLELAAACIRRHKSRREAV